LDEAEKLSNEALRLNPDLFSVYQPLSQIYMHRGKLAEAEESAKEYTRKDPQNFRSHDTLGYFYWSAGQQTKAIAQYEESVRLKPDHLPGLWNLVVNCDDVGEGEKSVSMRSFSCGAAEPRMLMRLRNNSRA
jgi:tetratricopeptide (TPR) repeat protein